MTTAKIIVFSTQIRYKIHMYVKFEQPNKITTLKIDIICIVPSYVLEKNMQKLKK